MKTIYFDHAATTPVKEEVLREMLPYFCEQYGNASAVYGIGRNSRRAIETARNRVANAINCNPKEIYFTSCGSESDNLALKGVCYANREKGKHIITTKIEHPAILRTCEKLEKQGFNITYLNVDSEGIISLQELENCIREDTILVTIMFANNEIGTIEPIEKIGKICKNHGIIFHSDCVQAIGNIKIDVKQMNIDMLSMSAHKFYGPKGVGALYVKDGIDFERIQDGGHQEKNKRAGTENVAGVVGLGKAIEIANMNLENYNKKLTNLRDYYFEQIQNKIQNVKINGSLKQRLPGNANVSFKGIRADDLLLKLDEDGISASAGSACSSGSPEPSHVLTALGLDKELAFGTLRTTFGQENTKEEIDFLVQKIEQFITKYSEKAEY